MGAKVRLAVRFSSLCLFVALVAFGCCRLSAAGPSLDSFTADRTSFDFDTKETAAIGNARLAFRDVTLTANEIRYNASTGIALARGNVILQQGAQRLVASEMTYRLSDRSFDMKEMRAGVDPIYVSGRNVRGTREEIIVEEALATFREPGPWTPTITARRLVLRVGETIEVDRGRVGVGYFQPFPLPGFPIPIDQAFLRYLTIGAGYRGSLGAFFELGVHVPVARGIEAGIDTGLYTNRGLLAGPSGRYTRASGDRSVDGVFRGGFIHDSGDKLRDILGERIAEDRGFLTWEHRQRFNENLSVRAEVNVWSDSDILRDFRPKDFYPVQQPDNFFEANYANDAVVVGAFVRPNLNRYFRIQERLPEIRATLLPQTVGNSELRLYQRGHLSLARLNEDAPLAGPTLKSDRIDAYYALTRPYTPREWLTIKPVAGVELTHYARTLDGSDRGDYTRTLGEVGLDAEVRASGAYAYQNMAWRIDGLRHLVTPRLSYRYIPEGDRGRAYIPEIDRRAFSTYLQPLGLGDLRNVDELGPTNTLRLAVDNTLQTRDAVYGSRDLVRLNLAADVRFDREGEPRTLSDLHTELVLSPARWLNFDLYQRYSTYGGKLEELNTGLTVANAEWWSFRLGTHYLASDIEEYVGETRIRLNEVFEGFGRLHYDSRRARFVQQTYGIRHTLDNLWVVQYGFNFYEGRRRESAFGFVVELETLRF